MLEEFSVTRSFDAKRDVVWKAFTQAKALEKWWGPKGFDIKVHKLDFKSGGIFHYSMSNGVMEMWGKFTYGEINEPGKITFVNSFSDKDGNITRNPWMATWPLEISNLLTLTEEDGKTKVTLTGSPINATDLERGIFEAGKAGMAQGFKGTFDQLDEYLQSS